MEIISRKEAVERGLPKYFTGKPCRRGHIATRYTAGACTKCVSIRKADLYQQNRESVLAYMKVQGAAYRKNNPTKRVENGRRWKAANKGKVLEQSRAQYAKNPERRREIARTSYFKRRDKERERRSAFRLANKGLINSYTGKRRAARIQRIPQWLSSDDKFLIEEIYSLAALRTKCTGVPHHVDHIIPLRGKTVSGLHVPQNLQVILGSENSRKGNRVIHA